MIISIGNVKNTGIPIEPGIIVNALINRMFLRSSYMDNLILSIAKASERL